MNRNPYDDRNSNNNGRGSPYDDRDFNRGTAPYDERNQYSPKNPYDDRNSYKNTYDDRNSFRNPNDDRNSFRNPNDERNSYDDRNRFPPNDPRNNEDYDDRNRYTNRDYEQSRLELERRNRIEDAALQRILGDVDKLASSECSSNVGAQWNFETNVNEATQQESVCKSTIKF